MNDFLQSLRSRNTGKQRVMMTRKSYDEVYDQPGCRFSQVRSYHYNAAQYIKEKAVADHDGNRMSMGEDAPSRLRDAVQILNAHMESFSEKQKNLVIAQERTITMLERQVIAVENLLDRLNILPE